MHCDKHREIFFKLNQASEYPGVSYVFANEQMRIRKLMDSIVNNNQAFNVAK